MKHSQLSGWINGKTEEEFNIEALGEKHTYHTFAFNYEESVRPYILKKMMDNLDYLKEVFCNKKARIYSDWLRRCFDYYPQKNPLSLNTNNLTENSKEYLKLLQEYDRDEFKLASWFASLEIKRLSEHKKKLFNTEFINGDAVCDGMVDLLFIFASIDKVPQFSPDIPETMYTTAKCLLNFIIAVIYYTYTDKHLRQPILTEKIKFKKPYEIYAKDDFLKLERLKGFKIDKKKIFLNDFVFSSPEDKETIENLLDDLMPINGRSIIFQNCFFKLDSCDLYLGERDVLFQSCIIDQEFLFTSWCGLNRIAFEDCMFTQLCSFNHMICKENSYISFYNCSFTKESMLDFSNLRADSSPTIYIHNSQIHCPCLLEHIEVPINLNIENVFFTDSFRTKGTKLTSNSNIVNIGFPTKYSANKYKSLEELKETLENSGLDFLAKELGLEKKHKNDSQKFDWDRYQKQLNEGFLDTECAAFYINKSISYLKNKRGNDKKKVEQKSLPFIIKEPHDIYYPLEGLTAYRNGKWDELKVIRKKYNFPKNLTQISE